ncbi:glycosyl transferase family 1 [Devosia pacifica]|uniref:Glycosyl transferase family 1 n=2 Tax=Devosia pacifica TaxID=1335967 RepID=A0A918S964_9HYPH|nr:glycosyl transferase family 1 [Devosia pacifica]
MNQGHTVQLAAPAQFEAFVSERGVSFTPLPGEFLALLDTPEGKAAVAGGQGFSAGFKLLGHVRPLMRRLLDAEWIAAKAFAPDLLIYHPKSIAGPHIGERLKIPTILASPLPGFTPTSAFPSPMLPMSSLGPFNKVSHQLAIKGAGVLFGKLLREWRKHSLDLQRGKPPGPVATVYGYSRQLVPVPSDWNESVLVSGYWFLDEHANWQMPEDLKAFLSSGEKPIYVGFGSMPGIDPQVLASSLIEGLALSGKRGLLATGGGALSLTEVPTHVHVIEAAPHEQLFKHVEAALHHGGAGTTGASLRAGVPTIICPFFGDQPFWGRRIASIGAGPPPIDRKTLTAEVLAAAFRAVGDPKMRDKAEEMGRLIREEDGVSAAIDFIDLHARLAYQNKASAPKPNG